MIKHLIILTLLAHYSADVGARANVSEKITISEIEYFGYEGLDLQEIKAALPLHIGDQFDDYLNFHQACVKIKDVVKKLTGKESTNEALIFYDKRYVVYVGLPGQSNKAISLLPTPTGDAVVSKQLHNLYDESMQANDRQLHSGEQKDKDIWQDLREQTKTLAASDADRLIFVLKNSANAKERLVAAHTLGLIAQNKKQLTALVEAAADSDHVVRNNAIRALGVLLEEQPALASDIPSDLFIDLVNSPDWTDRNKAVFVLLGLTKSRDPIILRAMRKRCLPSLVEMTLWPKGYSGSALTLLGRTANLPDDQIRLFIETHAEQNIIDAAQTR